MLNVLTPETEQLKLGFDENVKDDGQTLVRYTSVPPLVMRMTISDIHEQTRNTPHAIRCILRGTTLEINTDKLSYLACPNHVRGKQCKKILSENQGDEWYCGKCDKHFIECNYSYMARIQLQDHTGELWAIVFDEEATQLIGMPANELLELEDADDVEDRAQQVIGGTLNKQFIFTVTCQMETYNNKE